MSWTHKSVILAAAMIALLIVPILDLSPGAYRRLIGLTCHCGIQKEVLFVGEDCQVSDVRPPGICSSSVIDRMMKWSLPFLVLEKVAINLWFDWQHCLFPYRWHRGPRVDQPRSFHHDPLSLIAKFIELAGAVLLYVFAGNFLRWVYQEYQMRSDLTAGVS